jgi:hypothetical protein
MKMQLAADFQHFADAAIKAGAFGVAMAIAIGVVVRLSATIWR